MRKLAVLLICLATIIALFSVNSVNHSFSFETYLTRVSVAAENKPSMPSTNNITDTIQEYQLVDYTGDSDGVWKAVVNSLRYVWITLKVIYQCILFAIQFLIYLAEMILYLIRIISACTYNLLVW